ncbi:MAPEG family protein [Flocculibacter collagenilyticus]|uniref:MAPEG family protein n=1 Tax=Flocculibacter collagenilyticus TaxID=2744479 RepID=UPI0018F6CF75|nr:MAPEG family protein [Flocculibacter collagenilyticus]
MTTLLVCLLIAMLLPYLAKAPLAVAMAKEGGYDNSHPREQQSKLKGFGARALAAHQNSFEALIIFTPAVLVAIITHNMGMLIQWLAIGFIIARIVYLILYYLDFHALRTTVWSIGTLCSFAILVMCF